MFAAARRIGGMGGELHAGRWPRAQQTRNLLGATQLAALPRGAILINTARGELVDEPSLFAALPSGQASLPDLVLAPHVGGSTPVALAGMKIGAADSVLGWLQGTPADLSACVNAQVLDSSATSGASA